MRDSLCTKRAKPPIGFPSLDDHATMLTVKRWLTWFLVPVAGCLWILLHRSANPALLADTDTKFLLETISRVNNPMKWFSADWPLGNHFFRPVSTLVFEFDNRIHPGSAAGFGWTNAVLCCLCVLFLFWLVVEATDKPWLAGLASGLFALWHVTGPIPGFFAGVCWLASPFPLVGLVRWRRAALWPAVLASLSLVFLSISLEPVNPFESAVMNWIPGRTATCMTAFALPALALYARFERLSGRRSPAGKPTSTDTPLTKGARTPKAASGLAQSAMAVGSLALAALALGSYEQAVMLPALAIGVALVLHGQGVRPRWWFHAGFWCLLGIYALARHWFLPAGVSGYQSQQLRQGSGPAFFLLDYAAPGILWGRVAAASLADGLVMLLIPATWVAILYSAGNALSWWAVSRSGLVWLAVGFFALSFVSFAPMAWFKSFGHYHYLPSAFRSVYVVVLVGTTVRALISAVSPPALQAPARLRPAPGSLPRL